MSEHPFKEISSEEVYEAVLREFFDRETKGFHVDSRLKKSVDRIPRSRMCQHFLAEDVFLRLQFHANDVSRLLTPIGQPRTLSDCVNRMLKHNWTFQDLSTDLGLDSGIHNPSWFKTCLDIYKNFAYDKFYSIFSLPLTPHEKSSTPNASYSIFDGTHKSLVLAYKILVEHFLFEPVSMYLFQERELLDH